MRKIRELLIFLKTYKFALLLLSLFMQIVVPVFIADSGLRMLMSYVFISFTLAISIVIFYRSHKPKLLIIIVLAVFTILFINWLDYFSMPGAKIVLGRAGTLLLIYSFIFFNIFREFKRRDEVTIDFIFGAISGFVLIGLIGALLCFIVEFYYPHSFSFVEHVTDFGDFLYFSFVTITTLGYGDMLPTSNQGEVVSMFMAITGQLYLTIIIALIIGRYLANSKK